MVLSHELPRWSHIQASLGAFQEYRLELSLGFANSDDSFLNGIQIIPSLLPQKSQPHIQD